jgi:hypothetical protein
MSAITERARKYRLEQLAVLAHLDQPVTDADANPVNAAGADNHPAVREIRATLTDVLGLAMATR